MLESLLNTRKIQWAIIEKKELRMKREKSRCIVFIFFVIKQSPPTESIVLKPKKSKTLS